VALGLDQGGNGDAWGFDLAAERVTLAAAGLPWPHYFVDLSGVGGSADQAGNLVVIAACRQLAPRLPAQPSTSAPVSAPASGPPPEPPSAPSSGTPASPDTSSLPSTSTPPASSTPATPNPDASPSAPAGTREPAQGCMRPELIALNL
jgi:hypothetical protein